MIISDIVYAGNNVKTVAKIPSKCLLILFFRIQN